MSTRISVNDGLRRDRGVRRTLQRGVRSSLQKEKIGYLLIGDIVEETTEVLGGRDYCSFFFFFNPPADGSK